MPLPSHTTTAVAPAGERPRSHRPTDPDLAHRTGDVRLVVRDATGAPLARTEVVVDQTRHAFRFGCIGFDLIGLANGETDSAPPAFGGAQVIGRFLVLTGAGVPNGVQLVPVLLGSIALFTDVTSDGAGDVILFLPNATLVIDGRTGR